jgi:hypothetical protein
MKETEATFQEDVDKEELVRLILQTLQELGYK